MISQSKKTPSIAIIVTVLNERRTIGALLYSLAAQSLLPTEVIISDGGSSDGTIAHARRVARSLPQLSVRSITAPGNRSIGRNQAIVLTDCELIAITDAGCICDKQWLESLCERHAQCVGQGDRTEQEGAAQKEKCIIAGWTAGWPHSTLQKAMLPYTLPMPDQLPHQLSDQLSDRSAQQSPKKTVQPTNFLPATRSMLLSRDTFWAVGGFDERLSDNEDYAFAQRARQLGMRMYFATGARVVWQPRAGLSSFFWMLLRFARGDAAAGIVRPKVVLLFARYAIAAALVYAAALSLATPPRLILILIVAVVAYGAWSIYKHYRYCPEGWWWFVPLQLIADSAVLIGTAWGVGYNLAHAYRRYWWRPEWPGYRRTSSKKRS